MKNVLVTGGKGQLASCIKDIQGDYEFNFIYVDYEDLDITRKDEVITFFEENSIDYCINCAAYTAVDKAETEQELAESVNSLGVQYLVASCKQHNTVFIQISTDFVFDGKQSIPYQEHDNVSPLSVYGQTKLNGESITIATLEKYFVIRTSWLYSEHGNNFLKTMLRLGKERDQLSVVCDQIGTPTYAGDLARIVLKIIDENNDSYGIYHYSNEGVASWYDFAHAIFKESNIDVEVLPIKTEAYPTPAKRPSFSVMDKTKIKKVLHTEIPYWSDSLKKCLINLKYTS